MHAMQLAQGGEENKHFAGHLECFRYTLTNACIHALLVDWFQEIRWDVNYSFSFNVRHCTNRDTLRNMEF